MQFAYLVAAERLEKEMNGWKFLVKLPLAQPTHKIIHTTKLRGREMHHFKVTTR